MRCDILDRQSRCGARCAAWSASFTLRASRACARPWRSSSRSTPERTRIVIEEALRAGVQRVVHTSSIAAIAPAPRGAVAAMSASCSPQAVTRSPTPRPRREAEVQVLRLVATRPARGDRQSCVRDGCVRLQSLRDRARADASCAARSRPTPIAPSQHRRRRRRCAGAPARRRVRPGAESATSSATATSRSTAYSPTSACSPECNRPPSSCRCRPRSSLAKVFRKTCRAGRRLRGTRCARARIVVGLQLARRPNASCAITPATTRIRSRARSRGTAGTTPYSPGCGRAPSPAAAACGLRVAPIQWRAAGAGALAQAGSRSAGRRRLPSRPAGPRPIPSPRRRAPARARRSRTSRSRCRSPRPARRATNSCGIVGQLEIAESSWRMRGSGRMSTAAKRVSSACSARDRRAEKPHAGASGVPFMKRITRSPRSPRDRGADRVGLLIAHGLSLTGFASSMKARGSGRRSPSPKTSYTSRCCWMRLTGPRTPARRQSRGSGRRRRCSPRPRRGRRGSRPRSAARFLGGWASQPKIAVRARRCPLHF